MIATCPACEARFQVDVEQLGYDGRIVRCGKCGNCWHQMPQEEDPRAAVAAAEEEAAASPPPLRRRPPQKPPRKRVRAMVAGWILLLIFVVGVFAGGWFGREQIVAQFPQLGDLYALLGVSVTPPGPVLSLGDVVAEPGVVDGDSVLAVRGVVSNISDSKQTVPMLRAQLTDSSGSVLVEWLFESPQSELDAGAEVSFETQTVNPPPGAQNLSITFVETEG